MIARDMHSSISAAQWSLTAALLVGAVSAPILGRLGDGPTRRPALIGGLALVVVGCSVAAIAPTLELLVAGRALQGVGLGLLPLLIAVARDHVSRDRLGSALGLLSVTAAAGVGIGYPISGILADKLGLAGDFWFGATTSLLVLAGAVAVVPSSRELPRTRPDIRGAILLTASLMALLTAIAQGDVWRWTSAGVLILLAASLVLMLGWVFWELRCDAPLVQLRLLAHPAVLTCDVCAVVMGIAMYTNLPAITQFVQAPAATGYGFAQSVVVAGLCLTPFSVMSVAASRALPSLMKRISSWSLLPAGCALVALGSSAFATFHAALWEAFAVMACVGCGIGLTSSLGPSLIVRAVPSEETGSALGFFQVLRNIGFAIGSAVSAAILSGATPAGAALPHESGYTVSLWTAAGACVIASGLVRALSRRTRRQSTAGIHLDGRPATQAEEINASSAWPGRPRHCEAAALTLAIDQVLSKSQQDQEPR